MSVVIPTALFSAMCICHIMTDKVRGRFSMGTILRLYREAKFQAKFSMIVLRESELTLTKHPPTTIIIHQNPMQLINPRLLSRTSGEQMTELQTVGEIFACLS